MTPSHLKAPRRRIAVLGICVLALFVLPGTSVWAMARALGVRTFVLVGRTVAPAFGPSALAAVAWAEAAASSAPPAIGASMNATLTTDTDGDGKADPGDVIRYTTTITNSGSDATGVRLVDTLPSNTTLVGGSIVVWPIARGETYQSVGNMTLTTASIAGNCGGSGLFAVTCNDSLNGATLTAFGDTQAHAGDITADGTHTVTTVNGGTVTLNANGTFIYDPAAGFNGTDSFWYTVASATPPALTDTAEVSIEVGGANGTAWFLSPGGSGGGTQISPIGMAAFQAKNTLASPGPTDPRDGDTVFLLAGSHTGPVTLRASQALIGQQGPAGATINVGALAGDAPRPGNAYPVNPGGTVTIGGGSIDVVLNSDNAIANFTAGTATSVAIAGGAVGVLKIAEIRIINPSGGALAITSSGTFIRTATFPGFTQIITTGGLHGITLTGTDGRIEFGQGGLAESSGANFEVIGGTVTATWGGHIAQSGAAPIVSISGHSVGTIRVNSSKHCQNGCTGLRFDNADGVYNMDAGVIFSSAAAGITIANGSSGTFTFHEQFEIQSPIGPAFSITNSDATVNYPGDITKSSAGPAIFIDNHDAGTINFTLGPGDGGQLISNGASSGIVVQNSNGGQVNFYSRQKILNTGANPAITFDNNGGSSIAFVNGGLAITTTSGAALSATGGGTLTIEPNIVAVNTITTTTGTALNVSNTAIGAGGLTFERISAGTAASGPVNAIVLNDTGSSGGLTVTGAGTAGSGGTIQQTVQGAVFTSTSNLSLANMNFTNANTGNGTVIDADNPAFNSAAQAAINLNNASNVSFTGLVLDGGGGAGGAQAGINGQSVSNLTIAGSTVTGFGDAAGEGAVKLWNLTGTSSVVNSTFSFASGDTSGGENLFEVRNDTGTLALAVTGSTFKDTRSSTSGSSGLALRSTTGAVIGLTASNNDFLNLKSSGVETLARDTSTMNVDLIDGNVFDPQGGTGGAIGLSARDAAHLNFNVNRNEKIYGNGGAIVSIAGFNGAAISGRINNNPDIQGGGTGVAGPAIYLNASGNSTQTVEVIGNTIAGSGSDPAIVAGSRGDLVSAFSASLDVTASGNTITLSGTGVPGSGASGIATFAGASAADSTQTCVSLRNNTVTLAVPADDVAWRLQNAGTSNLYVEGWDTTASTTWNGRGNTPVDSTSTITDPAAPAIAAPPGGTCLTPSHTTARLSVAPSPVWASAASVAAGARPVNPAALRGLVERVSSVASALRMPSLQEVRGRVAGAWASMRRLVWQSAIGAKTVALGAGALVRDAADGLLAPVHASGETVDVDLGVVPAGKSVTVTFDVTVDAPPVAHYDNHATVVSTTASFADVDSNTVTTTGDRYDTTTTLISSLNPAEQLADVTFTATVAPAEGSGLTPDGTVQFKDNGVDLGSPVPCADAAGHACTAEVTTSALAAGTRSITANYLGGTSHDPSASNTVSQVISVCTPNPVVINSNDSGAGSLRQAIADACSSSDNNTVTFDMGLVVSPIGLTNGAIALTRDVIVSGPGAGELTIAQSTADPLFTVASGAVATLEKLRLTGGHGNLGGAIDNHNGTLTVSTSELTENEAALGGAIANYADAGQTATTAILNSTIANNTALIGGGILNAAEPGSTAVMHVTNSTIAGNLASYDGGGIASQGVAGASLTITNSTIAGNGADWLGTDVMSGGGIRHDGSLNLYNTIVGGNVRNAIWRYPDEISGGVSDASNNLIAAGAAGFVDGVNGNIVGTAETPVDARVGPLGDHGGGMRTYPLLAGSPAIDAGDNGRVVATTDQRGAGFVRVADGADADTAATVDIGAIEAQPTVEDITDKTTREDASQPVRLSFNVGDAAVGIDSVVATSNNQILVPDSFLRLSGSDSTRDLIIFPQTGEYGTATITVTATRLIAGVPIAATDTFVLTVTPVNDQPTLDLLASYGPNEDSAQLTGTITGITSGAANESQTLTVTATSDNPALVPDPVITYTSPDTTAQVSFTPIANKFGTAIVTVTVHDDGGTDDGGVDSISRQFAVFVSPNTDTPSVTNATTAEDTMSTSGLVVTRNPADGAEVTHVKITNIQNGSLFKSDGVTIVSDGAFLPFADAGAGLRFKGPANFFGSARFDVQASTTADNSGLYAGATVTATITITPVAEAPQVTGAATLAQVQTTAGLVITPGAADGPELTHYKLSAIAGGTVYKNDGVTPIGDGEFIGIADGAAGLKFTPATGFAGTATFAVQGATDGLGAGLGAAAAASIAVDKHATATSVQSADPTPSDKTRPVDVLYSVTSTDGGPVPTGTVTVVVDGSLETCTGTVTAGQCTLTSTTAGTRNIVATYNGDAINLGSDGAISHTFNECSINPIVQNGGDSGPETLREAVANACYGNTIAFGIAETITLSSPIDVLKSMTIAGPGGGIRLSGGNLTRVMHVASGVIVTLDRLTIQDGAAAFGAGIHNQGDLTLLNSTISANTAGDSGGGLWNDNGHASIVNSTISGNTAVSQWGGGIYSTGPDGVVNLTHVTITGNTAGAEHGGVRLEAGTIGNSIIAGNTAPLTPNGDFISGVTLVGANLLSGDPKLGPLENNGGPSFTHMPLQGSPVLDAGDNAVATAAGLTTDQRGAPYARVLDAADADTTQTADLGAVEADPTLAAIPNQTFDEGGSGQVTFNVGDSTTPFDAMMAFSDNPLVLLPDPVDLTSGGSTRTLTLAPAADGFGVAHVTIRARKRLDGATYQNTETTFTVTVNAINDPPTLDPIADVTVPEDPGQFAVPLTGISFGPGGEDELVLMTMTAVSSNTTLIPNQTQNLVVSFNGGGPFANLFIRPVPNRSGTSTITVTLTDPGGLTVVRTFLVTVSTVPDRPLVSQTGTLEDTPSFPFTILRSSQDGAEVTHFKLTNITGGTLALTDATPVAEGQFITAAQGAAALIFMPSPNSTVTGHFTVQASTSASDAGLGGPLVVGNVPVDSFPDPPIVTAATTLEDTQSTSGLVVTRNPVDGPDVTLFRVYQANNGTLFLPGSTTPITGADLITVAQGAAGLRFTPFPNFSGSASIVVVGIVDSLFTGLVEGEPGVATVTVTPVADTPSITSASTTVNAQTVTGLFVGRNPVDGSEVTHAKVTAITGGQLFQHDGVTPIGVGSFVTMAQGAAGLRFTPATDSLATGQVTIQASTSGSDAGVAGGTAMASIAVSPAPSTTTVVSSKNPSDPGELVTFTATVTAPVGTLTGTVQFKADFVAVGSPVPLVNGSAAFSTSSLPPGQTEIQAVYSGDTLAATSSAFLLGSQSVRAPVDVTVMSSDNPTPFGRRVTISAFPRYAVDTFTGPVEGGTVTFKEGATTLGIVPVAGGVSSLMTSSLTLGIHHLTVEYGGTAVFMPATGTFDQTISCPVLTISPSTIPPAVIGVPYDQLFAQVGGFGTIALSLSGTLPAGLSFDAATATISGVPLAAGTYPIQITATPAYACAGVSASYTLVSASGRSVLTGADAGGLPHARRFQALDGSAPLTGPLSSFLPFDASFAGGVRVAEGDVNGDGVPDYIAGAGPGGAPDVRIVDGASGALRASFAAFEPEFRGGVFVAAGDVNGDGYVDVIAGSGEGRSGQVKVFSGRDLSLLVDTFVFERAFVGGVRVAAGDVNGDGLADLVVGAGAGGTTVTVLSGATLAQLHTFSAYPGFTGGVFVAAGDVTGDGYADIVTGAGSGGGPHVKVFDGRTGATTNNFFAFEPSFGGGVRVAAGDVNGDGHAEIIVGAGPGGTADVRVFDPVTTTLLNTVLAYTPAFTGGVFVATAVPVRQMVIDTPLQSATLRSGFTLSGWAFEDGSGTAGIAGIAGIVVLAVPVDGGEPIAVGPATMGDPRPDVAAIYGGQYANAGFHMTVSGLPPGVYDLHVLARGGVSRVTNMRRIVRLTVRPDPLPLLAIDIPAPGRLTTGDFAVAGWALTPENPTPPGVDAVHVWAAPVGGGAWRFLGSAVLGVPRPDVAIAFGSQYATAGYYLSVTGLPPGVWDVEVFPRETGRAAFAAARVVRVTVPGGSTRSIMTGADAGGGPHVKRFAALDGGAPAVGALSSFFAFDPSFAGGVRVAEGDLNGDGVSDYIAGAGPGGAPEVRIIDGALGTITAAFSAFEPEFRGGVFVAAGDVNGDGYVDVIAGSGDGRRGEIKVFSGRDLSLLRDASVFDPSFTGGVHVAAGDVNGDGYADLIVGAGTGGADVMVLNAIDLSVLRTLTPYAGFFGVWVAAGDVTGDGFADVITGAGAGGGPHVRVFDGPTGAELKNFFAYEPEFAGGVRVAAGDVTGDGRADIITGPGPGRASEARVFDAATGALLSNTLAYSFTGGLFVATAAPVNRMAIDTPADGAVVHGSFFLAGWAFDENPVNAGIDAIHAWAYPVAGGAPSFGGAATLGVPRPDVAAIYGAQYAQAGFHLDVAGLAPGTYDIVLFGHASLSGTFNVQRVVRITVTP